MSSGHFLLCVPDRPMALVSLTSCPRSHSLEEPPPCFLPSPRPSHEGQVTGSSALLALSPSQLPRGTGLPCARAVGRGCPPCGARARRPALVHPPLCPLRRGRGRRGGSAATEARPLCAVPAPALGARVRAERTGDSRSGAPPRWRPGPGGHADSSKLGLSRGVRGGGVQSGEKRPADADVPWLTCKGT